MVPYKIQTPCFDSLAISLQSKDFEHLIPRPENPDYRVSIYERPYG